MEIVGLLLAGYVIVYILFLFVRYRFKNVFHTCIIISMLVISITTLAMSISKIHSLELGYDYMLGMLGFTRSAYQKFTIIQNSVQFLLVALSFSISRYAIKMEAVKKQAK